MYYFRTLVIFIITVLCFTNCEKEFDMSELKQLDKRLIASDALMNEPLIIQMFNELDNYNIVLNSYGILEFNSGEDANHVVDILQSYSDLFVTKEEYPNDPVLCAFETHYNFPSLRADIETQILDLEEKENLTEDNDPDNHYIVSPYMRAILTPNCEVIINQLICVYFETVGVGIMNADYTSLNDLHKCHNSLDYSEFDILSFCASNKNAFILSENVINHNPDFSFYVNDSNPNEYHFVNRSWGEIFINMTYYWDFGDGSFSTDKNPVHVFSSSGEKTVILTINSNGTSESISKPIKVGSCTANFSYSLGNDGNCSFSSTSIADGNITRYEWLFGDGGTANTQNPTHRYNSNGQYSVRLVIYTDDGCSDSWMGTVTISNVNSTSCCKANDREKLKYYQYAPNRKLKLIFRVTNSAIWHRIVSRTINFKIKSNGTLIRIKADNIGTGFYGITYLYEYNSGNECGTLQDVNLPKSKPNDSGVTLDFGMEHPFRVSKESITSTYYIKDEGVEARGIGLKLHQKPCN